METRKKLYRSREDRVIWGVCGGLADYFVIDPLVVRLIFIALFFGGGSGLLIYIIFALVVPSEGEDSSKKKVNTDKAEEFVGELGSRIKDLGSEVKVSDWRFILGLILVLIGFSSLFSNFTPFSFIWDNFWPLFLVIIGLIILFNKKAVSRK
ncbi:MAG: PspC domain-containing protein [Patescibacteria group bacterium]|nr:PspC domain-containing protein [Patescibacteria group bacterium]